MPQRMKIGVLALAVLISFAGWKGLDAVLRPVPPRLAARVEGGLSMAQMTEKPEQEQASRPCVTEPPFSGKFNAHFEKGTYICGACKAPLFRSDAKYDHGTGWPSFASPISKENLKFLEDLSFSMKRTEIRCAACGAHLGHVFNDGPAPPFEHYCINSYSLDFIPEERASASKTETAVFAAGCFWGVEYKFRQIKGVKDAEVGYTGGTTENPDYRLVCAGGTGHAEAVRVTFDPSIISYEDLVRFFFSIHDPTQINRQGPDVGSQYRSMIFSADEAQRETAQKVMEELKASGRFTRPIATGIVPVSKFTRAEDYHQRYYEKTKKRACTF